MKKKFSKREAALSLSVICALILGIYVISFVSTPRPAPKTDVAPVASHETTDGTDHAPASKDERSQASSSATDQEIAPVADDDASFEGEELFFSGDEEEEQGAHATFVMPEGVNYEPQEALFTVKGGVTADEVNAALASIDGVSTMHVSDEEIASGLVSVSLDEGVSVEDAVNELMTSSVVAEAQPNYVYSTEELMDDVDALPAAEAREEEQSSTASQSDATVVDEPSSTDATDSDSAQTSDDASDTQDDATEPTEDEADAADEATDTQAADDASDVDADEVTPESFDTAAADVSDQADGEASALETEASKVSVNDPHVGDQWGLSSIRAFEAWALQKTSGAVTVAVMDMGFDVSHPDLKNNLLTGYNAYNGSTNVSTSKTSDKEHGTHVAGIIAGESNNGRGISGASYNAKILPIKLAHNTTSGGTSVDSASIKRAFNYVIQNARSKNIRVVNLSVGSDGLNIERWMKDSIQEAYDNGIVCVASAGNLDTHTSAYEHYPSDIDECVPVMNFAQSGSSVKRSSDSNYNRNEYDHKEIGAPGTKVYSTLPSNEYGSLSGASMATPFVSAILALEFAAKPSLSADDAVNILYATTTDIGANGWDVQTGWGEANAYLAVQGAKNGVDSGRLNAVRQRRSWRKAYVADHSVQYRTHVQTYGWQGWKTAGAMSGTSGQSKRLEGIEIKLDTPPYSGGIQYRTHVQSYGWQEWKSDGAMSGTSGEAKRLEAIQIQLTGQMAEHYDVWYRVHAQSYGWLGWAKNGARAGTATMGKRLEGIEIRIIAKGSAAPGSTSRAYVTRQVAYRTHVQSYGWQQMVYDGGLSGTSGKAKRLEAIQIKLSDPLYSGAIQYRTHVQTYGWQAWKSNGATSGTSGQAKRLEAIQIQLTGQMAEHYDVWYRVHAQTFGWMGWTRNGAKAGTAGYGKRLEAIQIRLTPKGSSAPGSTSAPFRQR